MFDFALAYIYKHHIVIFYLRISGTKINHTGVCRKHTHTHTNYVAATHHYKDEKSSLCGFWSSGSLHPVGAHSWIMNQRCWIIYLCMDSIVSFKARPPLCHICNKLPGLKVWPMALWLYCSKVLEDADENSVYDIGEKETERHKINKMCSPNCYRSSHCNYRNTLLWLTPPLNPWNVRSKICFWYLWFATAMSIQQSFTTTLRIKGSYIVPYWKSQ